MPKRMNYEPMVFRIGISENLCTKTVTIRSCIFEFYFNQVAVKKKVLEFDPLLKGDTVANNM